ncbi:YceI family protein [Arthrobacter sp. UYEF3]|uniref:YceI family protein n=1 Tax=Arthrobacter sp. UYEF3 TaxID=1756365 RepID=UPI003394700B
MGQGRRRLGTSQAGPCPRNAVRDQHLRTNDFFDSARFPEITFVSSRVDQVDQGHFLSPQGPGTRA